MNISLRWLNEYLEPADLTHEEAERLLTFAGFPLESVEPMPSGDYKLDVEVTSNRGDVLSHIGCAREIVACDPQRKRRLRIPAANRAFNWYGEADASISGGGVGGSDIGTVVAIDNRIPELCPLFTARVVRSVKVGPSPKWLVAALESVGLRSINNVVDLTNFIAFEYGQPTHVFDLNTLKQGEDGKARLIVRKAEKGEKLALLDGRTITLGGGEMVIADDDGSGAGRVISLAGVMGGADTGVTEATTDVLIEAATWEPVAVRTAARRFAIRTDASYRYERIVDARTIETPAKRLASMIVKLAGGKLLPGVIHAGREPKPLATVQLRPARCRAIIGLDVSTPKIQNVLESHEIQVKPLPAASGADPVLACTIPAHRPDLEREIDLIEEVARTVGLDQLPVHELVGVRVQPAQASESATDQIRRVLNAAGFYETVTFTFVSPKQAKPFVRQGVEILEVCDDRRKADPVLRPSAIPSLLACRRKNQDGGAGGAAGVRLYEIASAFGQTPSATKGERGAAFEAVNLAMIADAAFPVGAKAIEQKQAAVRLVRSVIDSLGATLGGAATTVEFKPVEQTPVSAFDPSATAEIIINGERIGGIGLIGPNVQAEYGLESPVVAAEINLAALIALYPPKSLVHALPQFPAIERDLSLIVPEQTRWSAIDALVGSSKVPLLENWSFVGVYRGAQAGQGKKSVTFRMRFRDPARTLKHDEVSPQVETIVGRAKAELGAEVRTAS
jgi:phenylalanyl-tRNA synthetase beta chain